VTVLGIHPAQLPAVDSTGKGIRGLNREYAAAWPTLRNVPWFPAIGDGAAACIGSGCIDATCWSADDGDLQRDACGRRAGPRAAASRTLALLYRSQTCCPRRSFE